MAINFTSLSNDIPAAPVAASIIPNAEGFLDLEKNSLLDLSKISEDGERLKIVQFMAEWDCAKVGQSMDLDIGAITLGTDGKLASRNANPSQRAFESTLFHKHKSLPGLTHGGDNQDGHGDGTDEIITVDLEKVDPSVNAVVFVVWIHDADAKQQTFRMANNSAISAANGKTGSVLGKFSLKTDAAMYTGLVFSEVVRDGNGGWLYHTIGDSFVGNINAVLARFM